MSILFTPRLLFSKDSVVQSIVVSTVLIFGSDIRIFLPSVIKNLVHGDYNFCFYVCKSIRTVFFH